MRLLSLVCLEKGQVERFWKGCIKRVVTCYYLLIIWVNKGVWFDTPLPGNVPVDPLLIEAQFWYTVSVRVCKTIISIDVTCIVWARVRSCLYPPWHCSPLDIKYMDGLRRQPCKKTADDQNVITNITDIYWEEKRDRVDNNIIHLWFVILSFVCDFLKRF